MADDVVIEWKQPYISGMDLTDRWHGQLVAPVLSIDFALVAQDIHGGWYACIWPKGRMNTGPEMHAKFRSPERAKQQVHRWAQHHWRTISLWKHPQDRRI